MDFGRVDTIEGIDFTLPPDHADTRKVLASAAEGPLMVYVGCAKWNKNELRGFYPRGTKDELPYYASHFNAIELNATFYNLPSPKQIEVWRDKTPENFKFFPKISKQISHFNQLGNKPLIDKYCSTIGHFEPKLGMVFLQMSEQFRYTKIDVLENFVARFPKYIPLAVELRHSEWFNDPEKSERVYRLLLENSCANVIVDTARYRNLLHMRLSTPVAFVRFVGANVPHSDRSRLNDWAIRIAEWIDMGLRQIYFFVHQNTEVESPLLTSYFIEKLNAHTGLRLKKPKLIEETGTLF